MIRTLSIAAALVLVPQAAWAEETPICTDRPTKANAVCTVPAGKVQIETSLVGWSLTEVSGTRSEVLALGSSFAKFGLSTKSDLQVGFTPLAHISLHNANERDRISGFGDVVVRYKRRLTHDGAPAQIGVIPFIKLPTARKGVGNGKVEGGIAVPIAIAAGKLSVTFGPELDLLADADGGGHHPAIVNLVNIAVPVADRVTVIGELWSNFNIDPAGTVKQASADAALTFLASPSLQLDAGVNLGLTRETPDVEFSAGASMRF